MTELYREGHLAPQADAPEGYGTDEGSTVVAVVRGRQDDYEYLQAPRTSEYYRQHDDYGTTVTALTPVRISQSQEMIVTAGPSNETYEEYVEHEEKKCPTGIGDNDIPIHRSPLNGADSGEHIRNATPRKSRKQAREEGMQQLEQILRESNDIEESTEAELFQKELEAKARKAEQARNRYHRMTEQEKKMYNHRRRIRQLGIDDGKGGRNPHIQQQLRLANEKKAIAAKNRYHRMSEEEKRQYNMKRTEQFKRRREEEEVLLATPASRISPEALKRAQQIMCRNARKAEAARIRYQKMTPEERHAYNQKRAQGKRMRDDTASMSKSTTRRRMASTATLQQAVTRSDPESVQAVHGLSLSSDPALPSMRDDSDMELDRSPRRRRRTDGGGRRGAHALNHIPVDELEELRQREEEMEEELRRHGAEISTRAILAGEMKQEEWEMRGGEEEVMIAAARAERHIHNDSTGYREDDEEEDEHIEVDDGLHSLHHHNMQMAEGGLYEYHHLSDVYSAGPDIVENEVEVQTHSVGSCSPHSSHSLHTMTASHAEYLPSDPDMKYGMAENASYYSPEKTAPVEALSNLQKMHRQLGRSARPYQPRNAATAEYIMNVLEASTRGAEEEVQDAMSSRPDIIRIAEQRAKRALRAKIRYANMTEEQKKQVNARRAEQLRNMRRRDEHLVQLATADDNVVDDDTRKAIEDAQVRRNRRAEQARQKYRRMNEDERRQYNAMRDAQRRMRRRQIEDEINTEEQVDEAVEAILGRHGMQPTHTHSHSVAAPKEELPIHHVEGPSTSEYHHYDVYAGAETARWE